MQIATNHSRRVNLLRSVDVPLLSAHRQQVGTQLFNRELSLIEFFRRVLAEAQDEAQPLLERLKFLAIFASNLDEFFMIRVSGLKDELENDPQHRSPDGLTPAAQLEAIRARLRSLMAEHTQCLQRVVLPALAAQGIVITSYETLSTNEKQRLAAYFERQVFPVLTPQAVDPAHPFPYISGQSLNLGLMVTPEREAAATVRHSPVGARFVRVKVPPVVPRLVPVGESKFILLEDLVTAHIATLFPGMRPGACYPFRVTRDADLAVREREAEDLLESMKLTLRQRRFGSAVRLETCAAMPDSLRDYLTAALGLTPDDVYVVDGIINVPDLMACYKLDRPELKDPPLRVARPAYLNADESLFDLIRQQDLLLHHPYMPYSIITDFIKTAAHDPHVLAIKMCLYRTGPDSPIPPALIEAAEQGKQVTALVELKARFDEEHNIQWAKRLEEAGVHVVYGLLGLKTHCKVTLIVRREGDELRRYVHLATGNYNPETSAFYTDLGVLTAREEFGADASEIFNYLTGYSRPTEYRRWLVAPINLRVRMLELIRRETEHRKAGRPAHIVAKFNRLADTEIIRALYEASQAGVKIELIVRGICMLRPGVPGLSETIEVRSIVGRLLEHSRVYYFANGGDEEVYLGSADWMSRNLDRRVEILTPVQDPRLRRYLHDTLLTTYLRDNTKAWSLLPDGSYAQVAPTPGAEKVNSQLSFQHIAGSFGDLPGLPARREV